jgi:hypothetical protein
MKKLIYRTLLFATTGIVIVSCEKEDLTTKEEKRNSSIPISNEIPNYENKEELYEKLDLLNKMGENERREYEKINGYKSLLTTVYEVYEGIDMESITSITELEDYIASNPSYLSIKRNRENEQEYCAYYADNYYSAAANSDRVLIVGDICLKVFDDGIATAHIDDLNQLLALNEIFAKDVIPTDQITVSIYNNINEGDREACNIVHNEKNSPDNGNDRTKLVVHSNSDSEGSYTILWTEGFVRPYKKTLGIWYYAKRTCTGVIEYTASYYRNTTITINRNITIGPESTYKLASRKNEDAIYGLATLAHFSFIDSWGDTPSTANAVIYCY